MHDGLLPAIILSKKLKNKNFYNFNKFINVNFRLYSINNLNNKINSEYIQQFFVGLLEGDGCISVDKPKTYKNVRVRVFISLLNLEKNVSMLNLIKNTIGGRVVIERKNSYVTWIASNKSDLLKVFAILAKYPLLTTRKQCQLEFVKKCLINPASENFHEDRNNKYLEQNKFTPNILSLPFYFKPWLSGFIEAEGNFSLVYHTNGKIRKISFSIGQNTDKFILEMIKFYLESSHTITEDKNNPGKFKHYRVSIYGAKSRLILKNHFLEYPLLGNKSISFDKFISALPSL